MNRPRHPKVTEARLLPRLRRICGRLPGVTETVSWGHPTFKAAGKTLCVLERYKGHLTICFKLPPADANAAVHETRFFKTPYVGHKGWVSLIVDTPPDWREVAELAMKSFCEVAPDSLRRELVSAPRVRSLATGLRNPRRAPDRRPGPSSRVS